MIVGPGDYRAQTAMRPQEPPIQTSDSNTDEDWARGGGETAENPDQKDGFLLP
jgi:hypothetical protein